MEELCRCIMMKFWLSMMRCCIERSFIFRRNRYRRCLRRSKSFGVEVFLQSTGEILVDMDDLVFYEVAMEKRDEDTYLVTGNQKHYPIRNFIVTPAEMMKIIEQGKEWSAREHIDTILGELRLNGFRVLFIVWNNYWFIKTSHSKNGHYTLKTRI